MQQTPIEPFVERLRRILPAQWKLELAAVQPRDAKVVADALLTVVAPDGAKATLLVEAKSRISARQAANLASWWAPALEESRRDGAILFARFVSRMARERLRSAGVSYLDATGNAWVSLRRPAVFIEREGAEADPDPPRRGLRSLKGARAARIVRCLCDDRPPLGVREVARRTGANPGYVSRVLSFLQDEDVIQRGERGEVVVVRWQDLLRLWSRDYAVTETNRARHFLAARGLPALRERLTALEERYALTGGFAVPPAAQVVPGHLLSVFVTSAEMVARKLDLRETEAGANVVLLEPFDPLVFERTREVDNITMVALTQCTVDLLTGVGREPAQAEALMAWMAENEGDWRP
jgi:hypothetical protein